MESNVYLFSGDNRYALNEEIRRWIDNFKHKHGEENLTRLDGAKLSFKQLSNEIDSAPFIAEKRLVVVDGAMKCTKEQIQSLPTLIHPQVILLFAVWLDPAKRQKLTVGMKEIGSIGTVKEFTVLKGSKLREWILATASRHDAHFSPEAVEALLDIVGDDQGMLSQEIAKLSLYCTGRSIERDDVVALSISAGEREVWTLLDLIGTGDAHAAILYAESLHQRGETPQSLWSRMLWMLSQLVLVKSALEDGTTHPTEISRETGVNFFSVKNLIPFARRMDMASLRSILNNMVRADIDLKTGLYRATVESPQELECLIDTCIFAFAAAR